MKTVVLGFHDVVTDEDKDASGFSGPTAARYKLDREEFAAYLDALVAATLAPPGRIDECVHAEHATR
jgi:hypothetical protein